MEKGKNTNYEQFNILNIGFHNINRIKNNKNKLKAVIDYAENKGLDILGLGETNIESREGEFLLDEQCTYKCFWASAESNKIKGSGLGILIKKHWERHITSIEKNDPYYACIILD